MNQPSPAPETLRDLMQRLTGGEADPLPEGETWEQMIARIHVASRIHLITDETYDYFLEVLPPRWMVGRTFAFAEGQDPLQLFWARGGDKFGSADHFTRRLTDGEIDKFCRLTGVPRDYGGYFGAEF